MMRIFQVIAWSEGLAVWKMTVLAEDSGEAMNIAAGIHGQMNFSGTVTLRCSHKPEAFFR